MAGPSQIFSHCLDYLKGWPDIHALDYEIGVLDLTNIPTVAQPVNAGRVVHVASNSAATASNGTIAVGSLLQLGAAGTQMPLYLIQGQNSYDVSNYGYGNTDPLGYTAIEPAGNNSALVATGGYELTTTEFDQTPGVVYNPNDPLHAPVVDQITPGQTAVAGLLYKTKTWPGGATGAVTPFTDNICGIVSRGQYTNQNRQQVLAFWSYFLPGTDS